MLSFYRNILCSDIQLLAVKVLSKASIAMPDDASKTAVSACWFDWQPLTRTFFWKSWEKARRAERETAGASAACGKTARVEFAASINGVFIRASGSYSDSGSHVTSLQGFAKAER